MFLLKLPPTLAESLRDLSLLHTFLISLGIVFTLILSTLAYRLWFHPLSHIPGPFFARCSTLWLNYHYIRGTWHEDVRILHENYGPVVRIAHYEISFVDADALKRVYGHISPCKKVFLPQTTPPSAFFRFTASPVVRISPEIADFRQRGTTAGSDLMATKPSRNKISKHIPISVAAQPRPMQ